MRLGEQRTAVAEACRELAGTGLLSGTSGNVSVREPGTGLIAITPTGLRYPAMTAADVPVIDPHGVQLDGRLVPTSELALHLAVYRERPDVGAIVHTHSMFATTFAVLGRPIPPVHYLLARAGGGPDGLPIAPYARYGSPELAQRCVRALGSGGAVLLANHGLVAVGTGLAAAIAIAEAVEFTAELAWRAGQLGPAKLLTAAELAEAGQAFLSYGQPEADPEIDL